METVAWLESVSVIIASWTAVVGISSWRREFLGRRRIELAEDALCLFHQAADVVKFMRHPATHGGEGRSRSVAEGESAGESDLRNQAYVPVERYEENKAPFAKLQALRPRFVARFGRDSTSPFDDLRTVVSEIRLAARTLSDVWPRQGRVKMTAEQREKHLDRMHQAEAVIWDSFEQEDPIRPRVEALLNEIEATCRPVLEGRGMMHRVYWLGLKIDRWLCEN